MSVDVITYRLGKGNYCYILPPKSFEDGIRSARENFKELTDIDPSRITICVNGVVGGQRQHIRISPSSWPVVVAKLRPYEVLDILIQPYAIPDIIIHPETDVEKLPRYEDVQEKSGLDDFLAPSCHSSPQVKTIPLETIRAAQRYPRRTPSPSRPSQPKSSNNSSLTDIAKSIFGRGSPTPS